MPQKY